MFWRWKGKADEQPNAAVTFDEAKEAARRATFLNVAARMSTDEAYKQDLAQLFHSCRDQAIAAGAKAGLSQQRVDELIGEICDEDAARLQSAGDDEFRAFAQESGEIIKSFLNKLG